MESLCDTYENYVDRLENIIYDHIAIKLATYKGFTESLQADYEKTVKSFPLLHFIVESLQVDCVLTICKLTEGIKGSKTVPNFVSFTSTNMKHLEKRYPALTPQICNDNNEALYKIKEQIFRIKTQRDKYYAHSDNEYFLEPNKLLTDFPDTYNDLVEITGAFQDIISKHRHIIKGNGRICMSDFAYLNTYKTIDLLKEASDEWYKKYRPQEKS